MRTETGKEHIRSSGLAETLFSDYRRRVLALMLLRPDEHFHVREISRLTAVPAGSLHRELKLLTDAGLLGRHAAGNQVRFPGRVSGAYLSGPSDPNTIAILYLGGTLNTSYYIHGRDVPGYPASHGCIGLYDEEMQIEYYGAHDRKVYGRSYHPLKPPLLEGAQWLYRWVVGSHADPGVWRRIDYGPRVRIIGTPPL